MKKTIKVDEKPMVPNSLGFLKNQKKIGVSKNNGNPKMDGENNGKPYKN